MLNRRKVLISGSVGAIASLPMSRAAAQFGGGTMCPPGTTLTKFEISKEVVYYEVNLNITKLGGGGGVKIPRTLTVWKAVCEAGTPPPPPPPPPPPDPRKGNGSYYGDLYNFDGSWLDAYDYSLTSAAHMYWSIGTAAFAGLNSTGASLTMSSTLPNGRVVSKAFALARDASGFRVANPSEVDYWNATTAAGAISGSWAASDMVIAASGEGSGRYGVGFFLGDRRMTGYSGGLKASSGGGGGYFNDER